MSLTNSPGSRWDPYNQDLAGVGMSTGMGLPSWWNPFPSSCFARATALRYASLLRTRSALSLAPLGHEGRASLVMASSVKGFWDRRIGQPSVIPPNEPNAGPIDWH